MTKTAQKQPKTDKRLRAYSYLRFSTPEQMKGDSFRRQTEAAVQYASKNNLELQDDITYQDLGVSAFHGTNVHEGALGAFIEAIKSGHIESGSYLLVESLDRLSRQDVLSAFTQFSEIIKQGITIVTLQDGNQYSIEKGELGFSELITSIVIMQRAHEESLTKSKRLSAAWESKRKLAGDGLRKLTSRCPAWLQLSEDKTYFIVLEERAEIIRRIFKMTIDGIGKSAIARHLNKEGVTTFGRSKGWYSSYIQKILDSEAVIGVYQPHTKKPDAITGKIVRRPEGEPIEDYFPKIIEPRMFYKARQVRTSRTIPSGNTSKQFSNLFTGLVKCSQCGASMVFENKGRGPKGGSYLVCSNARRKVGNCKRHAWRYPETQTHIISNLLELDYRELFPSIYKGISEGLKRLQDVLVEREGELSRTKEHLERLTDLLLGREDNPTLTERFDNLSAQRAELEADIEGIKTKLKQMQGRSASLGQDYADIEKAMNETIRIEREGTPEEVYEIRRRLHQLLKKVIDGIEMKPSDIGQIDSETHHHGTIDIVYMGSKEDDTKLSIEVYGRRHQDSIGYKVTGDEQVEIVQVAEAEWPPVVRAISGTALWDAIKGE